MSWGDLRIEWDKEYWLVPLPGPLPSAGQETLKLGPRPTGTGPYGGAALGTVIVSVNPLRDYYWT